MMKLEVRLVSSRKWSIINSRGWDPVDEIKFLIKI